MAWDAQGRWKPDQQPALAEAAPVGVQQRQLTGLLAPTTSVPPQPTATPGGVTTTAAPVVAGDNLADRNKPPRVPPPAPPPPPPPPGTTPPPPGTTPPGTTPPPPSGFVMPATPTLEDDSVTTRLNGLLDSNSPYMQAARMAGIRQANSRGLLNSSIAGGNSEATAIAAAAPIASQEAAQVAQRNQEAMNSWYQLRNASSVQQLSDNAAWQRQSAQLANALQLQGMSDTSAMARLLAEGKIQEAIATMNNSTQLTQTQINANTSLISSYMNAFATLSQNPDLPAAARDAYMAEFLRVTQSGMGLVNALSGTTVTWPPLTNPGTTPGTPGAPGTPGYNGPTKDAIMAMQHDGTAGNFAAAAAAWNAAHPSDQIVIPPTSDNNFNPANMLFGVAGLLGKPFG